MTTTEPKATDPRKPVKTIIPREQCAELIASGQFLAQRKYDGNFCTVKTSFGVVIAEHMKRKSGGLFTGDDKRLLAKHGEFWVAFTLAELDGENVLDYANHMRWSALKEYSSHLPHNMILAQQFATMDEIDASMKDGGEGVCLHHLHKRWGNMLAFKREEIYLCRVTKPVLGTQSWFIEDAATGEGRGSVTMRGGKCDQVTGGEIIRVHGLGLTDTGRIREPRLASEWRGKV